MRRIWDWVPMRTYVFCGYEGRSYVLPLKRGIAFKLDTNEPHRKCQCLITSRRRENEAKEALRRCQQLIDASRYAQNVTQTSKYLNVCDKRHAAEGRKLDTWQAQMESLGPKREPIRKFKYNAYPRQVAANALLGGAGVDLDEFERTGESSRIKTLRPLKGSSWPLSRLG